MLGFEGCMALYSSQNIALTSKWLEFSNESHIVFQLRYFLHMPKFKIFIYFLEGRKDGRKKRQGGEFFMLEWVLFIIFSR